MIVEKILKYSTCTPQTDCAVYEGKIVVRISGKNPGDVVSVVLSNQFGCSYQLDVAVPCAGDYMVIYVSGHGAVTYL